MSTRARAHDHGQLRQCACETLEDSRVGKNPNTQLGRVWRSINNDEGRTIREAGAQDSAKEALGHSESSTRGSRRGEAPGRRESSAMGRGDGEELSEACDVR